jgi:hypothetical protein
MLGCADESVPVGLDVLWRAADFGDVERHVFGGYHLDGVPGADGELVRIGLLARDVDADLAAHAALEIDLAPLLSALDDAAIDFEQINAIDRADLEAGLAARAIVGVDNRQLFRNFLAGTGFGHFESRAEGLGSRAGECEHTSAIREHFVKSLTILVYLRLLAKAVLRQRHGPKRDNCRGFLDGCLQSHGLAGSRDRPQMACERARSLMTIGR